jgi:enamine deaminase RidA (YjgF/YER057c/UK114 family)
MIHPVYFLWHVKVWWSIKCKRIIVAFAVMLVNVGNAMAQGSISAEERLKQKNITLPPPAAIANYVGAVQVGNLLFASGNTAGPDGPKGKVGKELTVEQCYETARQTGLRVLSIVRATLGSIDRVKRVVKVLGMVNSAEGFGDQPRVVNGFSDSWWMCSASQLENTPSAVGMAALPGNACVEVEMIMAVE